MVKVKFLQSATYDPYNLAYFPGDVGEVKPELAKKLVEAKIAKYVEVKERTVSKLAQKREKRKK